MQGKVDSRAMREVNRSLLLDLIRRSGRVSRTDLARRSELTKPTVSAIVEELISEGVVQEVGLGQSVPTGGRRARLLEFNDSSAAYLGLRLGVHTTCVAVADARGSIRGLECAPTPVDQPEDVLAAALALVEPALRQAQIPRERLQGVGVALGGLVDARTGQCVSSPSLGGRSFPVRDWLQQALGLPVTVSDVADAAALAELRLGIAQGCRNFVWIYLGTGLGAGIVIDGHVYSGHRGFGGQLGQCRWAHGGPTLEALASGRALVERARELREERPADYADVFPESPSAADLIRLALSGDETCRKLLEEGGSRLGFGVAQLVNLLNPELVVVGGPLLQAGAWLLDPLRAAVEHHVLPVQETHIVPTELGDRAATAGAVLNAMEHAVQSYRIVAAAPVLGGLARAHG
jgi:predicted NBD/HSP70 family sugar kinase